MKIISVSTFEKKTIVVLIGLPDFQVHAVLKNLVAEIILRSSQVIKGRGAVLDPFDEVVQP